MPGSGNVYGRTNAAQGRDAREQPPDGKRNQNDFPSVPRLAVLVANSTLVMDNKTLFIKMNYTSNWYCLVQKRIYYEQPLNERIRTFLKLEFLFKQANHFLDGQTAWDSRMALFTILEIGTILARGDLKGETMKELERRAANLSRLEPSPGEDRHVRLEEILARLNNLVDRLYAMTGQIDQTLKRSEFLTSVKQRSTMPGGACDFDLPVLHHWLERPPEARARDLSAWLDSFGIINEATNLVLQLTRQSTSPVRECAERGFFQKSLDSNAPCQMIRVAVPANLPLFPEISGGKHRFTIRFMEQPNLDARAVQTAADVEFELTCCTI